MRTGVSNPDLRAIDLLLEIADFWVLEHPSLELSQAIRGGNW
jgi:hypothetical protein